MKNYQKDFAFLLAKTGAIFFKDNLTLKDGRPTDYFVNMGKFNDGRTSFELGRPYAGIIKEKFFDRGHEIDIISGPSYKASAIAQATAIALHLDHGIDVGFNYDRKEAKTHGEATDAKKMWVGKQFFDGCNWIIVDDVGTTMKTKIDHMEKVRDTTWKKMETNLLGVILGVDREQVDAVYNTTNGKPQYLDNGKVNPKCVAFGKRGEDAILKFMKEHGIPVYAGLGITETVEYLFKEKIENNDGARVVDEQAMEKFREYMKTEEPGYGADLEARASMIEELPV